MSGKRKLLGNSFAILVNRLTQSISTFALFIFLGRILGPYSLGQYTLAFNYYFLFMTLASQGFKTLFTRELSHSPEKTPIYLVSGSILQFFAALVSYFLMVVIVLILPYTTETSFFCCVLGLMIIPFSLSNITEAIFQAHERMHLVAISTVPVYIFRTIIIIWALNLNHGLLFVCLSIVFSEILILLIQWALITKFVTFKWIFDWQFIGHTLKSAFVFIAIEGSAVFKGRIPVIILSIFSDEVVVGFFGAILQLMQPFQIISHSIGIAFFPRMTKAVQLGKEKQRQFSEMFIEVILCISIPIIIGISFIGSDLLVLIYGNPDFAQAAPALKVVALSFFCAAFSSPLAYLLVANGLEKVNLFEVISTGIIGATINLIFIPKYQLMAAAFSIIFIQFSSSLIYVYFTRKKLLSLRFRHILIRPFLIGVLIFITFVVLQQISSNLFVTLTVAFFAYILQFTTIYVYAFGGTSIVLTQLMQKGE